jgi:hypothetical protein
MKHEFFSTDFRKILTYQMEICPMGAKLFHVDRWMDGWTNTHTDTMKLIVIFCNFANMPKNGNVYSCIVVRDLTPYKCVVM